jgi:hypothetical protein
MFTPEMSLSSSEGCFVKYTFPVEVDPQTLALNDIQAKGMFVSESGLIFNPEVSQVKHNFDSGEP